MKEDKQTAEPEKTDAVAGLNERLVMLPPYVEPEHRLLIEQAEAMLREYEAFLLKKIKAELFECGWNIEPSPNEIRKAERQYHEDPVRAHLLKQLVNINALCEKPRFMIKAT